MTDLDLLDIGMVIDMYVEKQNDEIAAYDPERDPDYVRDATPDDVRRF